MDTDKPLSKRLRKLLDAAAGLAYERELNAELRRLEALFEQWRKGQLSPFELTEHIHIFHQGPQRELWARYERGNVDWNVAAAVSRGILRLEELDADLTRIVGPRAKLMEELAGKSEGERPCRGN